jgi:hypothetical protein
MFLAEIMTWKECFELMLMIVGIPIAVIGSILTLILILGLLIQDEGFVMTVIGAIILAIPATAIYFLQGLLPMPALVITAIAITLLICGGIWLAYKKVEKK